MANGNGNSSARRSKFGSTRILPAERTMDMRSLQKATSQTPEEKQTVEQIIKQSAPKKHPGGRPPIYDPYKHPQMAFVACGEFGTTDDQLTRLFNVHEETVAGWKRNHPEFLRALMAGKDKYNTRHVERRLLDRAMGYSCEEVKTKTIMIGEHQIPGKEVTVTTKHMPPDPKCLQMWLYNRSKDRWKSMKHVMNYPAQGDDFRPEDINKLDMNTLGEGDLDELERIVGAAQDRGRTISAEPADG